MPDSLQYALSQKILQASWETFLPHIAQGNVFLVQPPLTIEEVGEAFVLNAIHTIDEWLDSGQLIELVPEKKKFLFSKEDIFSYFICAPFFLLQRQEDPAKKK